MAKNFNKYQYETSPRKIAPDYTTSRVAEPKKKKSTAKKTETKKQKSNRTKAKEQRKKQAKVIMYLIVGFLFLFSVCYRNAQIDEEFEAVQTLKKELADVEKQNSQLEIAIENNLNLNNVEQQAKELLGMQKLNNKQTVYINLQKTDHIEAAAEDVILTEESVFTKVLNTIASLLK